MSSDSIRDEFVTGREIRDDVNVPSWTSSEEIDVDKTECQNCGNSVTEQYRRVFGGNDDVVYGCPNCKTYRQMSEGGVARDSGESAVW